MMNKYIKLCFTLLAIGITLVTSCKEKEDVSDILPMKNKELQEDISTFELNSNEVESRMACDFPDKECGECMWRFICASPSSTPNGDNIDHWFVSFFEG